MSFEGEPNHGTNLDPSTLSFESLWSRRRIIASYWLVVLLAVPLWWKATSIDRLSLPENRVRGLSGKEISFPLRIHLDSSAVSHSVSEIADAVTKVLSDDLKEGGSGLAVSVTSSDLEEHKGYSVKLLQDGSKNVVRGRDLLLSTPNHESEQFGQSSTRRLADVMRALVAPPQALVSGSAQQAVKYASRYRLAFTLLNQDSASGNAALSWDIQSSIHRYLKPTLEKLSVLHNFTIESQVQLHAPLAFDPTIVTHNNSQSFGLTPEDLTVFVNSAEWTLSSSVSNDPVLHFVVFVPSLLNNPLYILDKKNAVTNSNAFILPQWGGIVVLNSPKEHLSIDDLHSTFGIFESQLHALLAVPTLPADVTSDEIGPFTDWQLDALVRRRTRENFGDSRETLESIILLVNQISNMPVGQDVKGDVQDALSALDQASLSFLRNLESW
ncbi:hypothetical protein NLI96_g5363 [Meripilus lineatus]|uniref:GPI transamidase component PIG-S n=1 Tax=Meripilus lineatus TaxID=2056292 RepID=A0AAD5YH02_9APHY|nr:hypothetical protein NLI96_g5363 [Physisporinus lineatus]